MTDELNFVKGLFNTLGKTESLKLINDSNLTEREGLLLELRLIRGKSLKEVADILMIEEDSVNKAQSKVCRKLCEWIRRKDTVEQVIALLNCTDYKRWQTVKVLC